MAGGDDSADGQGWEWDVVLSFAGAQRHYVEQAAGALKARGVRCFYDADEQIGLWGKHLAEELPDIYGERAAAAVVFISAEYAARDWTRLERRAALGRAVRERREYVLPARFDDTPLPGLLPDVATVDLRQYTPEQFAGLVADKLAALGILAGAPAGGLAQDGGMVRPAGAVRVCEANPRILGVHPAIQTPGAPAGLPAYVPRDTDLDEAGVRAWLRRAAERGGFVLLVGGSSAGKTRCAYECIRDLLADWWLLHPANADEVRAFAAAPVPRTVVWLDEIQHYLNGENGLTAATIRALLRASFPVVIVGTLWPQFYASYTALPTDLAADQRCWERELMGLAEVVVLPPMLSRAEQARARDLADSDARLREALTVTDYGMTQVLAAAPELVRWWESAPDPYASALLTAAIDARRIGVRTPLTSAFLRAAAEGYCDARQRGAAPDDWFERSLAYATETLHGAVSALAPVASSMGELDGYVVADFLLQHGHRVRAMLVPPDSLWSAVSEYVTDASDLDRAADSARFRRLLPHAERLGRAAAAAGVPRALFNLAELLDEQGRLEEAELAWRACVSAGGPEQRAALQRLQLCLEKQGRVAEAEQVLRDAATSGVQHAYRTLWHFMWRHDRLDEAVEMARQIVASGVPERSFLAELLDRQGRADEAETVMREAVAAGEPALMELGYFLENHDRPAEAESIYRQGVAGGEYHGYESLVSLLVKLGRADEAERVAQAAIDEGAHNALAGLVEALEGQGRNQDAEEVWRDAIAKGEVDALSGFACWLEDKGRIDEAERYWRNAVIAGERLAFDGLIWLLKRHGRMEEAEDLARNGLPAEPL